MNSYDRAARVAAAYLRMTEPIMKMPEGLHAVLAAMPDNAGVKGDVVISVLQYMLVSLKKRCLGNWE